MHVQEIISKYISPGPSLLVYVVSPNNLLFLSLQFQHIATTILSFAWFDVEQTPTVKDVWALLL